MTPHRTHFKHKREDLSKPQFKKRAMEVFARDNYTCQYTGRYFGPGGPIHCHHRVFKSQGGDDAIDNLTTCAWDLHHNHGALKHRRLITENDDTKIDELRKRYGR